MKKLLAILFYFWTCAAQAQIVGTLPFQLQNATTADATQVMADFNKILNDTNANGAKNGVNIDITALNALVTPLTTSQGGSTIYIASTSGGTANAQTVASPTPTGFTLSIGKRVTFIAGFSNTGAFTLNANSTGALAVVKQTPSGLQALVGGEIIVGHYIEAVYDGTQYELYTNASTPGLGAVTTLASAATTDLGTIFTHNISISGAATITSFGSTASTVYPVYNLKFTGGASLTYNATSLIVPGAASLTTATNDTAVALYLGSGNWQIVNYQRANGPPVGNTAATYQVFTSGSGLTYTRPANVRWITVEACGGGAGGWGSGGAGATTGGNGTSTTFSTFTGGLGVGGGGQTTGGAGGAGSGGSVNLTGGAGGNGSGSTTPNPGGAGGVSKFGAQGYGGVAGGGGGLAAQANSCSGGGGGGANTTPNSGSGGGAGGYVFGAINAPAATYTYSVGTGGSAGSAGASGAVGGAGGSGIIIVSEYY